MSREKDALNLSTMAKRPSVPPASRAREGWLRRIDLARRDSLARFQPGEGFGFSAKGAAWFFDLCDGLDRCLGILPLWQSRHQAMAWYATEAFAIQARSQKCDPLDVKMNMLGYAVVEALVVAWQAVKDKGIPYADIKGGVRLARVGDRIVAEVLMEKEES